MTMMSLDEYQDETHETAIYPSERGLEYLSLGLVSEAGEVAGKVKKKIRDGQFDAADTAAELGDVLWYVAQLAGALGYRFEDVAEANLVKLALRKERGVIGGSGDNR